MNLLSSCHDFNMGSLNNLDDENHNSTPAFGLPGFNLPSSCSSNPFNKPNIVPPFKNVMGGLTVNNKDKITSHVHESQEA